MLALISPQVVDRQGRTCLHLAALHIGKEHSQAVTLEEEELHMQAQREESKRQLDETHTKLSSKGDDNNNTDYVDSDYEDDAEHSVNKAQKAALELMERDTMSRGILRYLVSIFPQALAMENNFQATPVDTVLEKTKPVRAKNKIVSVYGLYNDPPTARLLLLAQRNRSRAFNSTGGFISTGSTPSGLNLGPAASESGKICFLPNLRPRYITALRDFNWMARKDVLYVSLVGELRYCNIVGEDKVTKHSGSVSYVLKYNAAADSCSSANKTTSAGKKTVTKAKTGSAKVVKAAKLATVTAVTAEDTVITQMAALQIASTAGVVCDSGSYSIQKNNLLARFRRQGMEELVRAVVAFV